MNVTPYPVFEPTTGASLLSEAYETMSDPTSWAPISMKYEDKTIIGSRENKPDCEIPLQEKNEITDEVMAIKTLYGRYAFNKQTIVLLKTQISKLESLMNTVTDSSAQILIAHGAVKNIFEMTEIANNREMEDLLEAEKAVKGKYDSLYEKLFKKWNIEMKNYKEKFNKISNEQGIISQLIREGMTIKKEEAVDNGGNDNDNNESLGKCSICCDNTVNRVLVPCGHTFCHECLNIKSSTSSPMTTSNHTCSICRIHFDKVIPLFIS